MDGGPNRQIRVLHLILMLGETNSQYNEHCLPLVGVRDLSICTYFVPRLKPPQEISLFAGDGSLRGFFRALRAALDAKEYDVVHAHAPQTGVLVPLALLALGRFRRLRASLVYTVHDSFYDYKLRDQAMMVMALTVFERIVFCGRAAHESVPRALRWLVRHRWRLVRNGADFERVDRAISSKSAIKDDRFTVLSVGRLDPVKDPMALLEAFARAADLDAGLVFIGTGALESAAAARARSLGVQDRVLFTGLIPRDEVFLRCASADVLVSTSHGEGLPVAVMEAMASRCPVILSDIPPHRELADGADFIRLIPRGDIEGFAREIRSLRRTPPEERLEIGRRCREHVTARFALPIMHAGYETVYRELVRPGDATPVVP
jgi:glycosyltransferase involved in cell wall biosynthesis